jgi:hypothetical protein
VSTRDVRTYEVRVIGHLDDRWASWFADLTLACYADGTCTLTGEVADQAQLHGILARLRDIGSTLVSVRLIGPDCDLVASAVRQQAELVAAADGGSSVVDAELGVDALRVRA